MLLYAMLSSAEFKVLLMYSLSCLYLSFALKPTVQQFDNLINLVLLVQYASLCQAAFSRIQSVVSVFIVLSPLLKAFSSMYIQQFDNLIHVVLLLHYASSCHAAFSRIQSVVNVFIVLSLLFICFKAYSSTV